MKRSKTKLKVSPLIKFPVTRKSPRAPAGLGKAGRRLWRAIQSEYGITDPGGVAHLTAACRAEDDLQRMRASVAIDGDVLLDRFGQKQPHPLLAATRGLEAVRRQSLSALNLNVEPLHDRGGRPSSK